ncbi:MAG: hemolysin III family protein [Candidatus Taylorbacteria bacterium]|nr:hemolysin III family protein [Candidatus Taylorbacteria bacterium]
MSRWNNEPGSFLTHFIGALFAVTALVLLIVKAVTEGSAWHIASYSIFGSALVLLYLASSVYHLIPKESPWKARLQVVDHTMIFVLIAGTYTPIALTALRGPWGWSLFGIVWGLALVGILIKGIAPLRRAVPHSVVVIIYALMGWIALVAIVPLVRAFSGGALALLFAGGSAYTLGIVFFALDTVIKRTSKWYGHHEIWHLFVIAGSACHFALIYGFLVG